MPDSEQHLTEAAENGTKHADESAESSDRLVYPAFLRYTPPVKLDPNDEFDAWLAAKRREASYELAVEIRRRKEEARLKQLMDEGSMEPALDRDVEPPEGDESTSEGRILVAGLRSIFERFSKYLRNIVS